MKKCLVGVVSWCDSNRFPERFKVFKKTVNSIHKYIPKGLCTVAVVDNDSTTDVQDNNFPTEPLFLIKLPK